MKYLDERQNQTIEKYATISFLVMYIICVVAIIVQLIIESGDIRIVLGETVVIMAGGILYLTGVIKAGGFVNNHNCAGRNGNGRSDEIIANGVVSILTAAIFSVFYAFIIYNKSIALGKTVDIGRLVAFFFVLITLLCFLVLSILTHLSNRTTQKAEQLYGEEDECVDSIEKNRLKEHTLQKKKADKAMNPQNIYMAGSSMEADRLIEILEKNGIPAFKKSVDGGIMDVYAGFSNNGDYIYVDIADVERAKKLVEQYKLS